VHGTPPKKPGIVAFITSSAWLKGPGFEEMRRWIRDGNDVWVVDLNGNQINRSNEDENVFSQIQTAVTICIVARAGSNQAGTIHFKSLIGSRESKFEWLNNATLFDDGWSALEGDPRNSITEEKSSEWQGFLRLSEIMPFHSYGVKQNRTWVNDASREILIERWKRLSNARVESREKLMKATDTRSIDSLGSDLFTGEKLGPINNRINSEPVSIIRCSFRTLDRQYLIADSRVIDRPRPELWDVHSKKQVFFASMEAHPIGVGPAISISGYIPDNDYFKGNSSGWIYPVFRDKRATVWNLLPGLIELINNEIDKPIDEAEFFSYLAGVCSFPGFAKKFELDLREGGVRIPITLQHELLSEFAALGTSAIELFTYCERTMNREKVQSTVRVKDGPHLVGNNSKPRSMPELVSYDSESEQVHLGDLTFGGVSEDIWNYQVSGMHVIRKWVGYRKAKPSTKWSSPLNDIVSETWPKAWTEEFLDLLHVIFQLRGLESRHEDLLKKVLAAPLLSNTSVIDAGLLPAPKYSTKPDQESTGLLD
jgi:hypothetical protein